MERHEREALDQWLTNPWEVEAPDHDPEQDEPDGPEYDEPDGFDDPEAYGVDPAALAEVRYVAALGGRGAWPAVTPRAQHWYDLDAGTAAALMVLAPVVAAAGGVVVFVARRFRVVRR